MLYKNYNRNIRLVACVAALLSVFFITACGPSTFTPQELYTRFAPSVVLIDTPDGHATGVIIDSGAHVLTVAHVVQQYSRVTLRDHTGDSHVAVVLNPHKSSDIALLKLDTPISLDNYPLLADSKPMIGAQVTAIGYPLITHKGERPLTLTQGVISTLSEEAGMDYIHLDAIVRTGSNGGPVFSEKGEIVGVIAGIAKPIFDRSLRMDEMHVAVSSVTLRELMSQLKGQAMHTPIPTKPPVHTEMPSGLVERLQTITHRLEDLLKMISDWSQPEEQTSALALVLSEGLLQAGVLAKKEGFDDVAALSIQASQALGLIPLTIASNDLRAAENMTVEAMKLLNEALAIDVDRERSKQLEPEPVATAVPERVAAPAATATATPTATPTAKATPTPTPTDQEAAPATAPSTPVTIVPDTDGGPITSGLPMSGAIDIPGDNDFYTFSGEEGAYVSIAIEGDGPLFVLENDMPRTSLSGYLTATMTYEIVVSDPSVVDYGNPSEYILRFTYTEPPTDTGGGISSSPAVIKAEERVVAAINMPGDEDFYMFDGAHGGYIGISVEGNGPIFSLCYDTVNCANPESGLASVYRYMDNTGRYYITVSDPSVTYGNPSEYILRFMYTEPPTDTGAGVNSELRTEADFGNVDYPGYYLDRQYRIANYGPGYLWLSIPQVEISGQHASDFVVVVQPGFVPLTAGTYLTFTVRFMPSGVGVRKAMVTIVNNDEDENPYTFAIQGTGVLPPTPTPIPTPTPTPTPVPIDTPVGPPDIEVTGDGFLIEAGDITSDAIYTKEIKSGEVEVAAIDMPGDEDIYRFYGVSGGKMKISIVGNGPVFSLYPFYSTNVSTTPSKVLGYLKPEDGVVDRYIDDTAWYYITVSDPSVTHGNPSRYVLRFTYTEPPVDTGGGGTNSSGNTTLIQSGQGAIGAIDTPGDEDFYVFSGTPGGRMNILIEGDGPTFSVCYDTVAGGAILNAECTMIEANITSTDRYMDGTNFYLITVSDPAVTHGNPSDYTLRLTYVGPS